MAPSKGGGGSASGAKSKTHQTTKYRQDLKANDPEKYQEYLEKQRQRAKKRRDDLKIKLKTKHPDEATLKKKEMEKQKQRLRQKKYREKKKSDPASFKAQEKSKRQLPQTRQIISLQKEYNKMAKRREREKMGYQKKEWVKRKERERKAKKRQQRKSSVNVSTSSENRIEEFDSKQPFSCKKTEWNVTCKVKKALPKSPKKFAKVVGNIIEKASPKKKAELGKRKVDRFDSVSVNELNKIKAGKKALREIARSYINKSKRFLAKKYKTGRRSLTNNIKKKPSKSEKVVQDIKNFYKREDISRVLPQKRYCTKEGPGYLLQVSIAEAHSKFNKESAVKVSLGRFAAKRPRNVRKINNKFREYCCCVYCINIRNKILTLNRYMPDKSKTLSSEEDILKVLLCKKSDSQRFYNPDCINGICEKCTDYKQTLAEYYKDIDNNKALSWSRWQYEEHANGKKKRMLITKKETKHKLMDELLTDVVKPAQGTTFFTHINTAKWQSMQFNHIKSDLPDKCVLQVMDFAKNREVRYQDEIKSVYYTVEQITMHPIVSYYRSREDQGIVREAAVFISDDHNHDHQAVHHFHEVVNQHLESKVDVEQMIVFSDGCSAQYKSRGPFKLLSESVKPINRNFFGSEHGKGDCDAEIGIINRAVDRAIVSRKVIINSAEDMFKFCQDNLELNDTMTKRKFFFVKKGEIQRENRSDAKTVIGTRKLHQILNTPGSDILLARNLTCFCVHCTTGKSNTCTNERYVHAFREITVKGKEQVQGGGKTRSKACQENNLRTMDTITVKRVEESKGDFQSKKERNPKKNRVETSTENSTNKEKIQRTEENTIEQKNLGKKKQSQRVNENAATTCSDDIVKKFGRCRTYEELKCEVYSCSRFMDEIKAKAHASTIIDDKLIVDKIAADLVPSDMIHSSVYPARVLADGNCLPRCVSVHVCGNEDNQAEMRARIVMELAKNEDTYLDYHHLCRGADYSDREAKKLPNHYAGYSQQYTYGDVLTENTIRRIYQQEVLEVCKMGTYMGIWQLFAAATVMNCIVNSVYPERGNPNVRHDLNRKILPICHNPGTVRNLKEVTIMWTSTREDMNATHWVPNHFVPLLPLEIPTGHVEYSSSEDEDALEISGLSGILDLLENECTENDFLKYPEEFGEPDDMAFISMLTKEQCSSQDPRAMETARNYKSSPVNEQQSSVPDQHATHTVPPPDTELHSKHGPSRKSSPVNVQQSFVTVPAPDTELHSTHGPSRKSSPVNEQQSSVTVPAPDTELHSTHGPSRKSSPVNVQQSFVTVPAPDTELHSTHGPSSKSSPVNVQQSFVTVPAPDTELHSTHGPSRKSSPVNEQQSSVTVPAPDTELHSTHGPSSKSSPVNVQQSFVTVPAPDTELHSTHGPSSKSSPVNEQQSSVTVPAPDTELHSTHGPSSKSSPVNEQQSSVTVPAPDTELHSTHGPSSFNSGQYLLIAHGTESLPAVVDSWPFVYFFSNKNKNKRNWVGGRIRHQIIPTDVLKPLEPPDVDMVGSRIYFQFNDL